MAGFNQQDFSDELRNLLKTYQKSYRDAGELVIQAVLRNIRNGMTPRKAVNKALKDVNFQRVNDQAVRNLVLAAACTGYGVWPHMLTAVSQKNITDTLLSDSWAADNVKLSRRLHTMDVERLAAQTIQTAIKRAQTVRDEAMALYDGYNSGKGVLDKAELPKKLQEIERLAREALNGDAKALADIRKKSSALKHETGKLESENLKAAYRSLAEACGDTLNEKVLERAVQTAIEERTRYYAERIARTEAARAWFDGYIARTQDDDDVWGYRWVLSSRHKFVPFDQCDVCANMNVGYGKGVYPKGKVPSIPRHPHCMCSLVDVITGQFKGQGKSIKPDGAQEYLNSLDDSRLMKLFGKEGMDAYKDGGDWQQLLRGWQGFEKPKSRLRSGSFQLNTIDKTATMKSANEKVVDDVQYVGTIDKEIYKVVTSDIRTQEVVITEKQIEHIQQRHPGDFEKYKQFFKIAIQDPDYILRANKINTAMILKEINMDGEGVKLILRLQTSDDPVAYKNSIITFQKISAKRYARYVKNAEILYQKG